jgi:hypothetical protein
MAQRAHILLPEDLIREIDALVGPRGRSAFLVETARNEVRRQKLLRFLDIKKPAWHDKHHPELAEGAGNWVRKLRAETDIARGSGRSRRGTRARKTT